MPRSPTVATQPPGTTPQVPLTPIPSAIWNGAMDDIYQIFNTPQPIEYGGTNAATAAAARTNLGLQIGVDVAAQSSIAGLATVVDTFKNRMVNSGKTVSQENGQTSGTTNGRYLSDQNAMFFVSSAGTFTGVNVQTISPAGGYRDRITITVADAALAAGEFLTYTQNLEGSNVRDFKWGAAGANQIVIRFGIKAPAGTYAMALHNSAANRSYVAMFTITAPQANTDTVQTFAVPGDVTGTWLTADGVIGVTMDIVLAAGTTFQGVVGWQAGNILATSAVSNGMGTAAAVFEFFDAGMRLDTAATGVYGSYEVGYTDAVYRAERYYRKSFPVGSVPANNAGIAGAIYLTQITAASLGTFTPFLPYEAVMNKIPTIIIYNPSANNSQIRAVAASADWTLTAIQSSGANGHILSGTTPGGTASGQSLSAYHYTANARLS